MVDENSPSDNDSVEDSENEQTSEQTPQLESSAVAAGDADSEPTVSHNGLEASDPQPITRYFSFIFLLGVIGLVGMIFYWVMARFLIPLFLAALLVVIFRPLHRWMLSQVRGHEALAALLTTLSILLAVLVPIALLIVMAAAEGRDVLKQFNSAKLLDDIQNARTKLKLDLPNANQVRDIDARLSSLQAMSLVDRTDLDSQSSDLFEIIEASNRIAQDQKYSESAESKEETDDEADDEVSAKPMNQEWQTYYKSLMETKDLQRRLLAGAKNKGEGESGDDSIDQYNSVFHDYREVIHDTSQNFDAFKYDLLGGRTRAFAVEFLNPTDEKLQGYATFGGQFLKDQVVRFGGFAGSVLGSLLLGSAIMIISLYFFLLDGPAMLESFKGLSPLDDEHEIALVAEFANVSRAVVVATLLSALAQGVLAGIGFYFTGLDSIFLLTLLSAVLAMVPFVGAAAVWVPCSLYLYFFENNLTAAIGLAIYGVAVISMADNFIKPFVLHGTSNLHPLLALLSVLGGVTALGPIGILIGPMVVVFLQTLLKILQRELSILDGAPRDLVEG